MFKTIKESQSISKQYNNNLLATDVIQNEFFKNLTEELKTLDFDKEFRLYTPEILTTNTVKSNIIDFNRIKTNLVKNNALNTNVDNNLVYNYKTVTIHEESTREIKNTMGKPTPVKLVKIPVDKVNDLASDNFFLLKFRFNDKNSTLTTKTNTKIPYFAFKQQRCKSRTKIGVTSRDYLDEFGKDRVVKNNFSLNNNYVIETTENPSRGYRMLRKNRTRSENMPVVVSKRLLRVKKTLVLPTHINITAVTNSYDVVHSWFIPGLGLKMDCVPGRSTHHTFFIDNAGFYYGQCAEICGRYHHHMPIRVCALPFEHFLLW